jgi:phage baseplate assembly protein gpV
MWIIYRGNTVIASAKENPEDFLVATFSMFRGQNIIAWFPQEEVQKEALQIDLAVPYKLELLDEGKVLHSITMFIEELNWNANTGTPRIEFTPALYHYSRSTITVSKKGTFTLRQILEDILKQLNKLSGLKFNLITDSKSLDEIKYKDFYAYDQASNIIAHLNNKHGFEWLMSDFELVMGIFIGNNKVIDGRSWNNTVMQIKNGSDKFYSGSTQGVISLPGQITLFGNQMLEGTVLRTLWSQFRWENSHGISLYSANDKHINEYNYSLILPSFLKDPLTILINRDHAPIYFGKILKWESNRINIQENPVGLNPEKFTFDKPKQSAWAIPSSPYAGPNVGLQFPETKESVGLFSAPNNATEQQVQIAQIFQEGTIPKRTNPDDFRLTLPDGGTLYYSKANGSWILSAKTKVLIGQESSLSSTGVPNPNSNYVEITSNGVNICGSTAAFATANHTHVYDHIQIASAPGAPTVPQSVQAFPVPTGPKTSTPDKITLKLKGLETTQIQS